jgi:hypothetical protein
MLGGRLYTYANGTTAQKTAYTDPAGAVPHTYTADGAGGQYIALNARGELPAPLYLAVGSYDIVLKRADGSTVWSRRADPIGDGAVALAAATGAALVGFNQPGGTPRNVQQQFDMLYYGIANVMDPQYAGGATPGAVVDSTAAIQAAINSGKVVFLPAFFKTTASLKIKAGTVFIGVHEFNSGVVGTGFTYPIFINDPAGSLTDFTNIDFSHMTIRNGTHALSFTVNPLGVQSLGDFRNVRFEFQTTRGVECNYAMIANNFTNCVWFYSVGGIKTGREANLNNFINCRFEGLDAESVIFSSTTPGIVCGGEANRFQGCRFEARNTPAITGKSVIKLDTCQGTVFDGCYFENTFQTILTEVNGNGTTTFQNGRHTGQESDVAPAGQFKKDVFVSDAIVNFNGNTFLTGSSGTANMRIGAENPGLYTLDANIWRENAMTSKKVMSRNKSLASGVQQAFFRFRRSVLNGFDDRQVVAGVVTVVVSGVLTGATPFYMNRTFNVLITGFATQAAAAQIVALAAVDDNAPGAVLAFGIVAGQPTTDVVLGLTVTTGSLQDVYAHVKLDLVDSFIAGSSPFTLTCLV